MYTGKILWYSERDKNGIIKTSEGVEYYFDISVVKDRKLDFKRGEDNLVTFQLNEKIKDCRCAKNVELVDETGVLTL